jgi:hypothetical protein
MPSNGKKATNQYMIRQDAEALTKWIDGFLRDYRVRDLSPHTRGFYGASLAREPASWAGSYPREARGTLGTACRRIIPARLQALRRDIRGAQRYAGRSSCGNDMLLNPLFSF